MLTYQVLSQEQVTKIYYEHMQQDFPPAEVKPLDVLHELMQEGVYYPYGWFDEAGTLTAYAFFVKAQKGTVALMDYFAVCSAFRSHGYGSRCLAEMQTLWRGAAGILAEVEDPAKSSSDEEQITRSRRVRFYQRNGLRATNVYSVLFGVPYVLHYFPVDEECADDLLLQELDAIYHVLFPQPIYEKNAQLWMNEEKAGCQYE